MMVAAAQITIDLPQPHPNQQVVLTDPARFRVVPCGRRFGKTELAKIACAYRLLKGQHIWFCSPTYFNSKRVWREFKTLFLDFPDAYINNSDMRLELPNGGWIEFVSTHEPDNLRGTGLDFAVLDEAAFMAPAVWDNIIRPMLLTTRGGALFLSSPFGQNWFYKLYGFGLDAEMTAWSSHHYTSYDNPLIDRAELEMAKAQTPDQAWQEEYLAEFLSDSGRVFRNVRDCAIAPVDAKPEAGHRYVMGLDWARDNDYTALIVIDETTHTMVDIDRFNQVGWALQRGRVKAMVDKWGVSNIIAEENSIGSPNIEALQAEGLPVHPFQTTAKSKPPLIEALALAFEKQEISIQPDETLIHELVSYQMERLASGYRYTAPPGMHDDTVIALALAWYGASVPPMGRATYF